MNAARLSVCQESAEPHASVDFKDCGGKSVDGAPAARADFKDVGVCAT